MTTVTKSADKYHHNYYTYGIVMITINVYDTDDDDDDCGLRMLPVIV